MDDLRAGRLVRVVRTQLRLRQSDVGGLADVDQKVVSLIERGLLERVSVARFRRVCAALEIEQTLELRWRGGLGDRLIDRGHALIVEQLVAELRGLGWAVIAEFSFNVYGERGSVDVLAWHARQRALLIVEVKTRLTDLQGMLLSMSRKLRLVPGLAAEQHGWQRRSMAHLIVMADTRANRTVLATHRSTFDVSFPARTAECRRWVRTPAGDLAGLWFVALRRDPPGMRAPAGRVRTSRAPAPASRPSP